MIKAALEYLVGMARPEIVNVGGRDYSTMSITPVEAPTPSALDVYSLTGLVDYVKNNIDGLDYKKLMVLVRDCACVDLIGATLAPFNNRAEHVMATFEFQQFPFGQRLNAEDFNIKLQAFFVDAHDRAAVLKQSGNITQEAAVSLDDDGVTQRTSARVGIARKEEVALKNPVTLAPYRTFAEIEQPASPFIFRMFARTGGEPEFALFEADGGKWENTARLSIKSWLEANLPEGVVVLA